MYNLSGLKTVGFASSFLYTAASFLNSFKTSDIDQLILALRFRFGVIFWSKKLDIKFSRVFIRYKDTH